VTGNPGTPPTGDVSVPRLHHHGLAGWAGTRLRQEMSNWRLFVVRLVTSGLAVVLTVTILPGLQFTSWGWGRFLWIGLVFGLLNAVVKPIIQFFALRYLVASYGLVVVLINSLMLVMLSWILGGDIRSRGVLPFLLGGVLVGVLSLVLDSLAGTSPPILDPSAAPASGERSAPESVGS